MKTIIDIFCSNGFKKGNRPPDCEITRAIWYFLIKSKLSPENQLTSRASRAKRCCL
ncbi:MAG: hypothetical protein H0V65_06070 [Chitinophagales bacterium]|nr:hypothetical protein [Chitinophagales bacterium]